MGQVKQVGGERSGRKAGEAASYVLFVIFTPRGGATVEVCPRLRWPVRHALVEPSVSFRGSRVARTAPLRNDAVAVVPPPMLDDVGERRPLSFRWGVKGFSMEPLGKVSRGGGGRGGRLGVSTASWRSPVLIRPLCSFVLLFSSVCVCVSSTPSVRVNSLVVAFTHRARTRSPSHLCSSTAMRAFLAFRVGNPPPPPPHHTHSPPIDRGDELSFHSMFVAHARNRGNPRVMTLRWVLRK